MYSTLNGAKTCARDLQHLLADSGLLFPLNKSREAIAKAGGFRDWHDLEAGLKGSAHRTVDPVAYHRRLLNALPFPCRSPVQAHVDGEADPEENLTDPQYPRHWYRDAWPYERAITHIYMGHPLVRQGSGTGQRLRANLVLGPLLNLYGGQRDRAQLDPDTLALVYTGSLAYHFRQDFEHRNFQREFERLAEARILQWNGRELRIVPPEGLDVLAVVLRGHQSMLEHWGAETDHPQERLRSARDVLAHLGAPDATRLAQAIISQGSDAYVLASGATLDLMTAFAQERRVDALAHTYSVFAAIHPKEEHHLRERVPAKIAQGYLSRGLGLDHQAIERWAEAHPGWDAALAAALPDAAAFTSLVDRMAGEIAQH